MYQSSRFETERKSFKPVKDPGTAQHSARLSRLLDMASTRSSVRKRSITAFLPGRKPKGSESLTTGQKKPPDKHGTSPITATPQLRRIASQPAPASPALTVPDTAERYATQPPPATSSPLSADTENDSTRKLEDTAPPQGAESISDDEDEDSDDRKLHEAWTCLLDKKLIHDVDGLSSDDIIPVLYKIASDTTLSKDAIKKSIEAAAFILEATIYNERQQELGREEVEEEEGEIRGGKGSDAAAFKAIEEMKTTLQDTIIRATTALEEATKELKESKTAANNQPRTPNSQPAPPTPIPHRTLM
ncbi:hypothetical protein AGABI2DRAFT_146930 [Agaricus bisporus var. bisporus H97]|uniref:hypothetical protein n=1 Tax=Agaricus bisporus var. bisporus (strain H97 / ATCC MYA-4626 / FGSC 10389) TaxID=936046 RepID=UPI00029F7AFA|nr:hypothetical protein AGABI2DRAFT_146930 [Agaricus bisporus var. bisporus H97]EKV42119.1 hypothetical protein AGABI2DRAFT_146930 [Agaricus bisporus var. bisporus H97]